MEFRGIWNRTNELDGTSGDDYIVGGGRTDWLRGWGGDDKIFGGPDRDFLFGGDGRDTLHGGQGDDRLDGGKHNDFLYGASGVDLLNGGSGNDGLVGGDGGDTLNGGSGNDTLFGGGAYGLAPVRNDGINFLSGDGGNDKLIGGDHNRGNKVGDLEVHEFFYGGSGNDTIHGNGGNDLIYFDSGNDTIYGGSGRDIFVITSPYGSVGQDIVQDFDPDEDMIAVYSNFIHKGRPDPYEFNFQQIGNHAYVSGDWGEVLFVDANVEDVIDSFGVVSRHENTIFHDFHFL